MKFIKKTTGLDEVLAYKINDALKKYRRVAWLVPGGSNIAFSVGAMNLVDETLSRKLVILQTDERYVKVDSPHNNWHQLKKAGFDKKLAKAYPIIKNNSESIEDVANRYSKTFNQEFDKSDYVIGQFGVGSDGHIAGIKPSSIAVNNTMLASEYEAEDYKRITMTLSAIRLVDEAIVIAKGADKHHVFEILAGEIAPPLDVMPSAILKQISNCTFYNDHINSD